MVPKIYNSIYTEVQVAYIKNNTRERLYFKIKVQYHMLQKSNSFVLIFKINKYIFLEILSKKRIQKMMPSLKIQIGG
jgi:hypothetical protein